MRIIKAIIKSICDFNNNALYEEEVRMNWLMTALYAISIPVLIIFAILATIYHW